MPWPTVRYPSPPGDPVPAGGSGGGAEHGEAAIAGYRLIRRLATGDRADVYLARARGGVTSNEPGVADPGGADPGGADPGATGLGAGLVVVRVYGHAADDEAIAREIAAMRHDGTGATPALLDVATLGNGRCCLVVERIGGEALASVVAPGGLLPGQAVTALAPMVVAVRELAARGLVHTRLDLSDVVLDDAGRPRLLGLGALDRFDPGGAPGARVDLLRQGYRALLRLIEDVAAATRDRRALDHVVDVARSALDARPFRAPDEELERALFAVATPLSLPGIRPDAAPRGEVPSRVLAVANHEVAGAITAVVDGDAADGRGGRPWRWARLAEVAQFPAGVAADVAETLDRDPRTALSRRLGGLLRRRRGALITGGFVGSAALVALLTAVPPSATESDAGADAVVIADAADAASDQDPPPSPAASPARATAASAVTADDPVAAAAALLEIRMSCLASLDMACLAAVAQPGSPIEARDRAAIVRGDAAVESEPDLDALTVVADLGDAVVVSVPDVAGQREPASLLMMWSEAGWRLREWFD